MPVTSTLDRLDHRLERRLFAQSVAAHVIAAVILFALGLSLNNLSRDSTQYHYRGLRIAEQYASGEIEWSKWIDDGWFQFLGVVYYLIGPYLVVVTGVNFVLAGFSGILLYRIALLVFERRDVAYVSAFAFVWFPSAVYYTTLPLKEAAAICALLAMVWGTIVLITRAPRFAWPWIIAGLMVIACLRVYLVVVCIGCIAISLLPVRLAGGIRGTIQLGIATAVLLAAVLVAADSMGISLRDSKYTEYMDLERINDVRESLSSRGRTALFDDPEQARFGQGLTNDIYLAAKAAFFVVFSIDVTSITRSRQLAALPEMLFFLVCLPSLWVGIRTGWRLMPNRVLPIFAFGLALVVVYGAGATNAGAMYRWRLQALPFFLMPIVYGSFVRGRGFMYHLGRRIAGRFFQGRITLPSCPARRVISPRTR